MRMSFAQTLLDEAQKNRRIMLLTGDLGFSVFEDFIRILPNQFINMGVAEQNMAGVAAGLSMEGKIPVIYSITPFVCMRNFEQIRNDICYQKLNVKIVGVGAGFAYGPYGHTHHGLEDIGVMRTLAGMVVLAPGDPTEVRALTKAMLQTSSPTYLRLGKSNEKVLYAKKEHIQIGKGTILRTGEDATIIVCSTLTSRALESAEFLSKNKLRIRVISMHTVKPIDRDVIVASAKDTKAIITLEDHSVIGGLGSAVAEVLAENGCIIPFRRIGVPDRFTDKIGLQEYMQEKNGLGVQHICDTLLGLLNAGVRRVRHTI